MAPADVGSSHCQASREGFTGGRDCPDPRLEEGKSEEYGSHLRVAVTPGIAGGQWLVWNSAAERTFQGCNLSGCENPITAPMPGEARAMHGRNVVQCTGILMSMEDKTRHQAPPLKELGRS